jgi:hypothetical protein
MVDIYEVEPIWIIDHTYLAKLHWKKMCNNLVMMQKTHLLSCQLCFGKVIFGEDYSSRKIPHENLSFFLAESSSTNFFYYQLA